MPCAYILMKMSERMLLMGQRSYDSVVVNVCFSQSEQFFLDVPGRTGNIFTKLLLAKVQQNMNATLAVTPIWYCCNCVAWWMNCTSSDLICGINKTSEKAQVLKRCRFLVCK